MQRLQVLKSHTNLLTTATIPVMKKHPLVRTFFKRWNERHMAVRQGTLFYANTPDAVLTLADTSHPHTPGDEHVIVLKGCSVQYCPEETDSAHHWAFKLTTPEVMLQSYSKNIKRRNADPPFAEAGTVVVHQRCSAQTGHHGDHQALFCAARCWGCDLASNT